MDKGTMKHGIILALDVEQFSKDRTAIDQAYVRQQLQKMVKASLCKYRLTMGTCSDSGDGFIAALTGDASVRDVLQDVVGSLRDRLIEHNRRSADPVKIRIRLVLHRGDYYEHGSTMTGNGFTGSEIILACRLLDSETLRSLLKATKDPLAVLLSEQYHHVLRETYPALADQYQRVNVPVKGGKTMTAFGLGSDVSTPTSETANPTIGPIPVGAGETPPQPPEGSTALLRPKHCPKGKDVSIKVCEARFHDYRDAILNGLFTPFLGPLCQNLSEVRRVGLGHLARRKEDLCSHLAGDGLNADARRHVEALFVERLGSDADDAKPDSCKDLADGMTDLQVKIAEATVLAARLLGFALIARPEDAARSIIGGLAMPGTDEGKKCIRDLAERLLAACDLLAALADDEVNASYREPPQACLGCQAIREKLAGLIWSVFGEELHHLGPQVETWRQKHHDVLPGGRFPDKAARICGDQVAWLDNLLWLLLRFDSPVYPTTTEIAFQLALCVGKAPAVNVRVRTAAEALATHHECVAHMFEVPMQTMQGNKPRGGMGGFHRAIARLLHHNNGTTDSQVTRLVVSTNLDIELEWRLFCSNQRHFVLFPVLLPSAGPDRAIGQDWLLAGPEWQLNAGRMQPSHWWLVDKDDDLAALRNRLGGLPLVAKVHGSPLHALPRMAEASGENTQTDTDRVDKLSSSGHAYGQPANWTFKHRLIVADHHILNEAALGRDHWPKCLHKLLNERRLTDTASQERVFCYMGYDLGDAGEVVVLHQHAQGTWSPTSKRMNRVLADHPEDVFRHAILENLDIARLGHTLEGLAQRIHDIPGLNPL